MVKSLKAPDRTGLKTIDIGELDVKSGEIVGIAGISGNGQKEFLEVLAGQRQRDGGEVLIKGSPYRRQPQRGARAQCPLHPGGAAAQRLRAEDDGGREHGLPHLRRRRSRQAGAAGSAWARSRPMRARLVEQFKVKTASLASPIQALSGGNVQRAVLARELTGEVDLLIVSNPCFGLDFSAVAEIRARIMKARNAGTAVLLMSEDLDELLELSDRILVMSDGRLVYETPIAAANVQTIGEHMAGHH